MKQNRMMENYLQRCLCTDGNLNILLKSKDYLEADGGLVFPLGLGEESVYIEDLSKISSMLVSGTTGSGKTSFIHAMINSLILQYTDKELKFIIVDSKGVDYAMYKDMPHLIIPTISEPNKIYGVLNWLLSETEKRLSLITENKVHEFQQMVLIIDDFALTAENVNNLRCMQQILAVCRKVNIHCVLCTSMPTKGVIPLELKANIPYRIAFHAPTKQLSTLVLDKPGAETLFSPGEAYIKNNSTLIKCQMAYASDGETKFITNQLIDKFGPAQFDVDNTKIENKELFEKAEKIISESGVASPALLQRGLKIGYEMASKIIEQLRKDGKI